MAAARNIFHMRRVISTLARHNQPSLSALKKVAETSCQHFPAARSIFTRSDFYKREFQTQTNPTDKADNDSKNHKTGCSQPDSGPAIEITFNSGGDYSSPKHSVISSLKTSEQRDIAAILVCQKCETRSLKTFCRESYEKGVVLARCGGCNNLHLVADRLGLFGESGRVEDFLAAHGEEIVKDFLATHGEEVVMGSVDTLSLTVDDSAGKKND